MSFVKVLAIAASFGFIATAFDPQFGFKDKVDIETRSLDEIHQAALKEGGVVTLWHGGDEPTQQNFLKTAFEARFPGMTLNVTVDLSKYHDVNLEQQLASDNVYVDSIILQTLHDFPRWKSQGVLLPYKPAGFNSLYPDFQDPDGTFAGLFTIAWSLAWNTRFLKGAPPKEYTDFLRPEFKDKLVLTYPNDDDAILYQFDLILKRYGYAWFEALLAQNPRWVRGTATPGAILRASNGTYVATFTGSSRPSVNGTLNAQYPSEGEFVIWPQTGAILKDAPHPESAKLLHSFIISPEHQRARGGWSTRKDIPAPSGLPALFNLFPTNPTKFSEWMNDRAAVERLRFFFESRIGSAQGLSPLIDGL